MKHRNNVLSLRNTLTEKLNYTHKLPKRFLKENLVGIMTTKEATKLELVVWNFVRKNYEDKFNKIHIPLSLKYIILKFAKLILECDLLSNKEDLDLYQILSTQIRTSINSFTTLYKASENDYNHKIFHKLCDGKASTVTIIESSFGNIFGGYSKKPWPKINETVNEDTECFLFLLKSHNEEVQKECPKIFHARTMNFCKYEQGVRNDERRGPVFGEYGICIGSKCNDEILADVTKRWDFDWDKHSFTCGDGVYTPKGPPYISGTNADFLNYFQVIDYYVIQINYTQS